MPEKPEELYLRAAHALRMPKVDEWETFPFQGQIEPRALIKPSEIDPPREGEDGIDCRSCSAPDDKYVWTDESWRLYAAKPNGLPLVVLLEPRNHFEEPGDLPEEAAADLGIMLGRVERAMRSIDGVGRVHACRWGDGGAHLHWWFMARPARFPQLLGSFAAIWDDILPPTPEDIWRANVDHLVNQLSQ